MECGCTVKVRNWWLAMGASLAGKGQTLSIKTGWEIDYQRAVDDTVYEWLALLPQDGPGFDFLFRPKTYLWPLFHQHMLWPWKKWVQSGIALDYLQCRVCHRLGRGLLRLTWMTGQPFFFFATYCKGSHRCDKTAAKYQLSLEPVLIWF